MSTVYLQGPVMYPRVTEDTKTLGYEDQYKDYGGMYQVVIGLDDEDAEAVMKWNRMYEPKELGDKGYTEDKGAVEGKKYFTFKRRHNHMDKKGETIGAWSGPPEVVDAYGNPWDMDVAIGNGSICTVKLDVTKPKGSKITYVRLEKIRVDEHEPYEGGGVEEEEVDKPANEPIPF